MREIIFWVLIAVSVPAVWRRPFLGLIIYLAANIIRPEMFFWGGYTGNRFFIFYYALIIFSSFFKGYFRRYREVFQKEFLLMLWMISAIYLSILHTQYNVDRDYYYAFELVKSLGLCAMTYMLVTDFADIQRLQTIFLGCFTFIGIWGIEQKFRGNERLEGLLGDSNGMAAMFVMFLPVALARAYSCEKRRDFWVSFGIAAIMVAVIVCTRSRGGLLGLLVCLFSFLFYAHKTVSLIKITLILVLLVSPFATESYLERMNTMKITDSENMESSARSRLILWQSGLMVIADNVLIGTGFMTNAEAKMKYEDKFSHLDQEFRESVFRKNDKLVVHNTYIQMLSDCGIAGGIPFILLIAGGIYSGLSARRKLFKLPENRKLLWLCGISAGVTGYSVCIIFINSALTTLLYVQLVLIGIISRNID